jgi:hypothetical protein
MGVNETTCLGPLGHHHVAKFYVTKYCLCVADSEISTSGQKKLYMNYKMRVSRYGGWCALVCGIVGGGHLPWVLLLLVFGEGLDGELGLNASNFCVGDSSNRRLVVGSRVTLVSDTSCSTGTFVYCTGYQCTVGVLSVAIVTVVMGSARGTDTDLCCMWESQFDSLFAVYADHN